MKSFKELLESLRNGEKDQILKELYAPDGSREALDAARNRVEYVMESFAENYGFAASCAVFSGPGRTEIGGNHTDHQHGHVLCGSVNLDTLACAAPNNLNCIRIISEGYAPLEISLDDLNPHSEETNTTAALVRGVAARIAQMGYSLSGFDAYAVSNVIAGAGLSSSASFEVRLGNIFNRFSCDGKLDPIQIAAIGQYAENVYFGKPCGLMDQMGSSVGGAVAIDFLDPSDPIVKKAEYDFGSSGYSLCIIDTGSCHADLTEDYASIPKEMGEIAGCFGKKHMRDVPESVFLGSIRQLKNQCGERAVLRAMHFYAEDKRAVKEAEALENHDFASFLSLVNESGMSSEQMLQNIWSPASPRQQAITLTLAIGRELLEGTGAIRVHGGGFAGTVQAFVPNDKLETFKAGMEELLGEGMCHVLYIRSKGGCTVME